MHQGQSVTPCQASLHSSDSADSELSEGTRNRRIRAKTKYIEPQKIDMEGMIQELDDRARMLVNGRKVFCEKDTKLD